MQKRNTKRNVLALYFLLLPLVMGSIHSCEYNSSDDNFFYLEKPGEQVQVGIDLAGVNPEEIIYVYPSTQFSYSLFTQEKEVLARQFYFDGEPIETDQYNGVCNLHTDVSDTKIHELKLVIALKTNSGSLAEHVGLEMYVGEFNFKIKIIPFSNKLNIRQTTDPNNYLKLEWDKPGNFEISGYDIYDGNPIFGILLASITHPDETYFVDYNYAYGYKYYTVVAKIKNSLNLTIFDEIFVDYLNLSDKNFDMQRISLSEMLIKWHNPNPFPRRYVMVYEDAKKIIIEDELNEAILPVSEFPYPNKSFNLYILPKTANPDHYQSYSFVYGYCNDKHIEVIDFQEDLANKQLLGLTNTSLESYDVTSMKKTSTVNHNLQLNSFNQLQASKEGWVAINDNFSFVHVYNDHTLKNKISILEMGYSYDPFFFSRNNSLLIVEQCGFKIYDSVNKDVICTKIWYSEIEGRIIEVKTTVSPDGKYVFVACSEQSSSEWTELYEINEDGTLEFLGKSTIADIQSITFHPFKNNEVIIGFKPNKQNKFILMDIFTKEQKEIKGKFMHIDPFTGNLLYWGEEYLKGVYNLYILDKNYSKEIIKLLLPSANPYNTSKLFNNYLFYNGYYMNLPEIKEWSH